MGKSRVNKAFRRAERNQNAVTKPLIEALEARARAKCQEGGHDLSFFSPAKKKFGKSVQRAWCSKCGAVVMLMPYHEHNREHQQVLVISGEILFTKCQPR